MDLFQKIVNGRNLVPNFEKSFILDVSQGSQYAFADYIYLVNNEQSQNN